MIPALYLKGISTGDFTEALSAILGEKAAGLSATNIVRLKAGWEQEYKAWCQRDLSTKAYVYWWADGIYFNVRLDEERSCVLVLIGALEDGTKELLAVVDGYRESTQSWPVAKVFCSDEPENRLRDRLEKVLSGQRELANERLAPLDRAGSRGGIQC